MKQCTDLIWVFWFLEELGTKDVSSLSQLYCGDPKNVPDGEEDMQEDH